MKLAYEVLKACLYMMLNYVRAINSSYFVEMKHARM